jgi:hypothetical protein
VKAKSLMYYARISSLMAEIEGMKAANQKRLQEGYSVAYTEDHLFGIANDLNALADKIASEVRLW